jgi:phosphopantothenoylcysteine decarboxylase
MPNILLGVTGSVAAIRTPELFSALTQAGHTVKIVATNPSLYFFDANSLPPGVLHDDADEWPRRAEGRLYVRDDPVLHIELRRWAELLLIAPLDANTLAKLAVGISDNCLTCVWRAWDPARPVILAPAMNTFMWEHPLTRRHLRQLIDDHGECPAPADADLDALVDWLNRHCPQLRMVGPISKKLACGDVGLGGMAEVADLLAAVQDVFHLSG